MRKHQKINYAHFNEHGYSESTSQKAYHIEGQPDDERFEIVWYGCDACHRWLHRHCLSTEFQIMADLSCIDETTKFVCPACPVEKLCVVGFVQGENVSDFIQCNNCYAFYHKECLPQQQYDEYLVYLNWHQK